MKNVNGWRLLLARNAGKTSIASAESSSSPNTLMDSIANSLESSGLGQRTRGCQVGTVIERALSGAGLKCGVLPRLSANDSVSGILRAHGMPGMQITRANRRSEGDARDAGQFLDGSFQNAAGIRSYKLYIPSGYATHGTNVPLVVMLHGCTQSPDDFAAGTQMNRLAERDGFLVLYPAQSANANGSNCWNWFRAEDQQRDRGEPSLIAGLARQIVSTYRVDPTRVFVAGLSAGAAMAVVLGATYPDVFAAVGAHSGLAHGAAHDVTSAFSAMKGGGAHVNKTGPLNARMPRPPTRRAASAAPVPTIVFHGDHDYTVDAGNGAAIARQAYDAYGGAHCLRTKDCERLAYGGRNCSRTVHADATNRPVVEHWILHGAGHAWSGGDARGSYVDVSGPSASIEMMRFFQSQARAGNV